MSFPIKEKAQCGWGKEGKPNISQTIYAGVNTSIDLTKNAINANLLLPNTNACVAVFSKQNNLGFYFVPGEDLTRSPR